jgi:diguanylate cyclase (GGDEF)-like protein/PAS domain S-box-containing protein
MSPALLPQAPYLADKAADGAADPVQKTEDRLRRQYESTPAMLYSIDHDGRIIAVSDFWLAKMGYARDEVLGRESLDFYTPESIEYSRSVVLPAFFAAGRCTDIALTCVRKNGVVMDVLLSAFLERDEAGEPIRSLTIVQDVTEQLRLARELDYRASHDRLTGLLNRTEFEVRLGRLLERTHQDNGQHALLYLDLDQFKLVNDTCGHATGDGFLQQAATLAAKIARSNDIVARVGGDEFAIILEDCSPEQSLRSAQELCERMDHFRYADGVQRYRIGASIGLVPIDSRWRTTAAILQAADATCYSAKENGRNRIHVWVDSDSAMSARHGDMQWTTRIESALDEDRFVLFAQRIEGLRARASGVHAEVLVRMTDHDGSIVLPGAFLPAAERFGLASRIDRWVVSRAIAWVSAPGTAEAIENLSINLSGQSVGDPIFHRWVLDALAVAGPVICSKLCFEVTETAAVTNLAVGASFIHQLRTLNVRVALDDFGAGASSFGYLKTLPVDFLKIDGQFVSHMVDSAFDEVTVRCFVDIAKAVGVRTVAEMVDSAAALERLESIGVDHVQGFLLHRPAPIDALLLPTAFDHSVNAWPSRLSDQA